MHGIVAAFSGADRIGAARIVFSRSDGIVSPLAVGPADWMYRREIDHLQSHRADLRQPGNAIVECAVPARYCALAVGDHFIPSAVTGARSVNNKREQLRSREITPRLACSHCVLQLVGEECPRITILEKQLTLSRDQGGRL